MGAKVTPCIYCGELFDPFAGEGDHIISSQLGEFRNDVRFRRICPPCNNRVGKSEQQLLRCSPEAFMRGVVKPAVPTKRRRNGQSWSGGAMGAPALEFSIEHDTHFSIVQPSREDPRNVSPVNQLVLKDKLKGEIVIKLFPGMTASALRQRIDKAGCTTIQDILVDGDDNRWEEIKSLVISALPGKRIEDLPPTEAGVHRVRGRVKMVVNEHYFRALAKIGFHYYLSHTLRGFRGDEPEFEPIREFIMAGTPSDVDKFFLLGKCLVALPPNSSPRGWMHAFAAVESQEEIIVQMQMFLGPSFIPPPNLLRVGSLVGKEVLPMAAWGHVYLYDDIQGASGTAGTVREVSLECGN